MPQPGQRIDVSGTLLRSDRIPSEMRSWKELELNLHRVPVDHVSKHVRITGLLADEDQIDVEGVIRAEERRSGRS